MKQKILFIEDDYMTIECAVMHLQLSGYDVHVADDLGDALARLRYEKFTVVFLDVMLPPEEHFSLLDTAAGRYTGLRLLELVHSDGRYKQARDSKWILVTNWRDEPEVESVAAQNGVCILRKPLSIDAIEGAMK